MKDMETVHSNHHLSIGVSHTRVFSENYLLFFITNRIFHKYIQASETNVQASMDKHVGVNKVLTITVAKLHVTVLGLNDSLKEYRMESDDALTKQRMELVQKHEDKHLNTKVINIACQLSIGTCVGPHPTSIYVLCTSSYR